MGQIALDSPQVFIAKGETNQIWSVAVNSGTTYEVIVEPKEVLNPNYDGAQISVCARVGDICPDEDILASTNSSHSGAKLTFVSPHFGEIFIHVIASLGERGENLGTFTITIRES